jgi:uncharacterized surface protein with fasciclin (FAS1) repeats
VLFLAAGVYATIADAGTAAAPAVKPAVADNGKQTIYDLIKGDPTDYKTLGADIDSADMVKTYQNDGPFTVFAPDETAFGKLTPDQTGSLTGDSNRPKLVALLSYATVKGTYTINDLMGLPDGTKLVTLAGTVLTINTTGGVLTVNGIPVVGSDQKASNGYVHTVQTVLIPADLLPTAPAPAATPAATTDTTATPAPTTATPVPPAAQMNAPTAGNVGVPAPEASAPTTTDNAAPAAVVAPTASSALTVPDGSATSAGNAASSGTVVPALANP